MVTIIRPTRLTVSSKVFRMVFFLARGGRLCMLPFYRKLELVLFLWMSQMLTFHDLARTLVGRPHQHLKCMQTVNKISCNIW